MSNKHSPHLNFINAEKMVVEQITYYLKTHKAVSFLNIGAGVSVRRERKPYWNKDLVRYDVLDIDKSLKADCVIYGDICNCPHIPNDTYDIVHSHGLFEHVRKPWLAAKECVRITKPGGINIHRAPFAARYHPVPTDCFRYTHTGFGILFEDLEEVLTGYDINNRRANKIGGKVEGGLDLAPVDKLGGWKENWLVLYIGKKL